MISIFIVAAGIWAGAIVFQSAVVAPAVFAHLDETQARRFLRRLFPRFFRLGLVCGVVMATSLAIETLTGRGSNLLTTLAVLTAAMLIFQAISLALVPLINAARDAGQAGEARFGRLHRLSVVLTVLVLLLDLFAVVMIGQTANVGGTV